MNLERRDLLKILLLIPPALVVSDLLKNKERGLSQENFNYLFDRIMDSFVTYDNMPHSSTTVSFTYQLDGNTKGTVSMVRGLKPAEDFDTAKTARGSVFSVFKENEESARGFIIEELTTINSGDAIDFELSFVVISSWNNQDARFYTGAEKIKLSDNDRLIVGYHLKNAFLHRQTEDKP